MDREKLFLYNSGILHLNQHCFNRKMKQTNKQTQPLLFTEIENSGFKTSKK